MKNSELLTNLVDNLFTPMANAGFELRGFRNGDNQIEFKWGVPHKRTQVWMHVHENQLIEFEWEFVDWVLGSDEKWHKRTEINGASQTADDGVGDVLCLLLLKYLEFNTQERP